MQMTLIAALDQTLRAALGPMILGYETSTASVFALFALMASGAVLTRRWLLESRTVLAPTRD